MERTPPPEGTLGRLIYDLRGTRSQGDFADLCRAGLGINQGAVSRWERNEKDRRPSFEQFKELVRVAGGTTDDLSRGLSLIAGLDVEVRQAEASQ